MEVTPRPPQVSPEAAMDGQHLKQGVAELQRRHPAITIANALSGLALSVVEARGEPARVRAALREFGLERMFARELEALELGRPAPHVNARLVLTDHRAWAEEGQRGP